MAFSVIKAGKRLKDIVSAKFRTPTGGTVTDQKTGTGGTVTTAVNGDASLDAQVLAKVSAGQLPINLYNVASRTLAAIDVGHMGRDNYATTISVTLPSDSTLNLPNESWGVISAIGVGQVTFVADAGVTINSFLSYKSTAASFCPVFWYKTASNTYTIAGRLAP